MQKLQRYSYMIWLTGSVVWWGNAALALHGGHRPRALASLLIAMVFFLYGMWLAKAVPPRKPR